MRISRFYCPQGLGPGARVELPAEVAHHAISVLRLSAGAKVVLFDGSGAEYEAELERANKSGASARMGQPRQVERESRLDVRLAQGVSGGERMDFTLQKAVELGVAAVQPLTMQRSVVRLSGERAQRRVEHWQRVVIGACEQSGRATVPPVAPLLNLPDWLGGLPRDGAELRVLLDPLAERRFADLPEPAAGAVLLAGPEGGFAPDERDLAEHAGFLPVRLGPRVLRTETAALAALAAMQTLWGDF